MGSVHLRIALGIYGALALIAWGVCRSLGGSVWALGPVNATHWVLAVTVGLLTGAVLQQGSARIASHTRLGRALRAEMATGVRGTQHHTAAALALVTALGEELLFRGALLGVLREPLGAVGALTVSSVLFGLFHVPRTRAGYLWTAMATAAGFALGSCYLATGFLLAPVVAHALVNFVNLRALSREPLAA